MPAPATILRLVERFHNNLAAYKDTAYLEAQLRVDFLNPFMQALGWDIVNAQGLPEHLRDVRSEDKVTVNESEDYATKAPDYGFYTHGKRRFFLEAKKPSIFLFKELPPAFQLRRYAWSAKLPLSILTDFEEFAVYDCRVKPDKSDAAATARILYLTYTDYADKWDTIAELFHKDAVLAGSLEKFAETKVKKGSEPVDEAFLRDIERWRQELAVNIARNNPALSERDINRAVQTSIDRIVFLRIAEDHDIEEYGQLKTAADSRAVQERLVQLYHKADSTYNSGLFHFEHEKGRDDAGIDDITSRLKIDDTTLRAIINKLYFPESPYAFAMIPPEVLGQVYEQFLGKVIVLNERHEATVEEKPEVRKAGGVYYTPQYIVEYITENTVGKLLADCKNPKEADTLRICDPACGSGSFLLGAYQFVLNWYAAWYDAHSPEKHPKAVWNAAPKGDTADWQLTIAEKKRILLNSFYGVDIDAQAVEVTKLSLMLKALEGESAQTLAAQRSLYKDRILPDLEGNIKCGNSLIGTDFYAGQQFSAFDEETRLKINAFDWDVEFASVMGNGGFDAVVGNPPYVRIQVMKEFVPHEVEFFKIVYASAKHRNYDIYVAFIEKVMNLLKPQGLCGFIVPNKFMQQEYGEAIRGILAKQQAVQAIVNFKDNQVFRGATTYTCLLFLCKTATAQFLYSEVAELSAFVQTKQPTAQGNINSSEISSEPWMLASKGKGALLKKLSQFPRLESFAREIFVGLQTSADKVMIVEKIGEHPDGSLLMRSAAQQREYTFEPDILKPIISGADVKRYGHPVKHQFVLFPYHIANEKVTLIPEKELKANLPLTYKYLRANRDTLAGREQGRMDTASWYGYVYLKNMSKQEYRKLCVPRLVQRIQAVYDSEGEYYLDNVDVGGITLLDESNEAYKCMLGLLNSRLLTFFLCAISTPFRGGYYSCNKQYTSQLPIPPIPNRQQLTQLVSEMLTLHENLAATTSADARKLIQRQIAGTDKRIDALVYALYGLTAEEIAIVENVS